MIGDARIGGIAAFPRNLPLTSPGSSTKQRLDAYPLTLKMPDTSSLDWSPDGQLVVLTVNGGPAEVRRQQGGGSAYDLGEESGVTQVAWSPDGTMIAVGAGDGAIEIWGVSED